MLKLDVLSYVMEASAASAMILEKTGLILNDAKTSHPRHCTSSGKILKPSLHYVLDLYWEEKTRFGHLYQQSCILGHCQILWP